MLCYVPYTYDGEIKLYITRQLTGTCLQFAWRTTSLRVGGRAARRSCLRRGGGGRQAGATVVSCRAVCSASCGTRRLVQLRTSSTQFTPTSCSVWHGAAAAVCSRPRHVTASSGLSSLALEPSSQYVRRRKHTYTLRVLENLQPSSYSYLLATFVDFPHRLSPVHHGRSVGVT